MIRSGGATGLTGAPDRRRADASASADGLRHSTAEYQFPLRHMSMLATARPHINPQRVAQGFSHLIVEPDMLDQLGPAIDSGRAGFLYGPPGNGAVRRRLCQRFPYGLLYTIAGNELRVLAVMNLRRRPGYWGGRT